MPDVEETIMRSPKKKREKDITSVIQNHVDVMM